MGIPGITEKDKQVLKIDGDGVPGLHRTGDAINGRNVRQFRLEGTEELIPEDKDSTEILVEVFRIDGMMHAVMSWRHDNMLQETQVTDVAGMIPELREEVQGCDGSDYDGGNPQYSCRNQEESKQVYE